MKNSVPIFALLIGYLGAITKVLTEAKSVIGFFAAVASLTASLYAIALSHRRLKNVKDQNPFAAKPRQSSRKSWRSSRSSRLKRRSARASVLSASLWLIPLLGFTACSTRGPARARADKALTQSNERLAEES